MYRKVLFIVAILISLNHLIVAQKGHKGYVVTIKGDTIYGRIKKTNFADLRGSKCFGKDGEKIKITTNSVKAFKVDREKYVSVKVSELGIKDKIKNNGSLFVKEIISGPVSLYSVSYCFGKKSINDRQNKIYKERCPRIFYFKKGDDPYFEAYRKEDVSIGKVKQKFTGPQIAGYFQDYEDLSKEILYQVISRDMIDVMVKKYNDWRKVSK